MGSGVGVGAGVGLNTVCGVGDTGSSNGREEQ